MATIENKDFWDLRDLAELARECTAELEDVETDEDDRADSVETLGKLAALADELGSVDDPEDGESVADALETIVDNMGPTLISEDSFVDYCKELLSDIGDLPDEIPSYISNNIDWDGVADDLRVDYTNVTFDGSEWLIR